MLFVGSGITVEVTTFVIIFQFVTKCWGISDILEARESWNVSVGVDVNVLHIWLLNLFNVLLLIDFLLVHLGFLLVFLDRNFDAMDKYFRVVDVLGSQCLNCWLVAKSSWSCNLASLLSNNNNGCYWCFNDNLFRDECFALNFKGSFLLSWLFRCSFFDFDLFFYGWDDDSRKIFELWHKCNSTDWKIFLGNWSYWCFNNCNWLNNLSDELNFFIGNGSFDSFLSWHGWDELSSHWVHWCSLALLIMLMLMLDFLGRLNLWLILFRHIVNKLASHTIWAVTISWVFLA